PAAAGGGWSGEAPATGGARGGGGRGGGERKKEAGGRKRRARAPGDAAPSADNTITERNSDCSFPEEIPRAIALSLFERMATNREIKHKREIEWAVDNKHVQEQQLALQKEQIEIQCEQLKIQREQWEWTRFQDENEMMLMDLNNVTETVREYFMSLQQEILQRRRTGRDIGSG
ncbi:hypothetical protein BS78_04G301400, partial [Paspalum vaginatum]